MTRSRAATRRRGASVARVLAHNAALEKAKKDAATAPVFEPPADPGNLCRRCFQRPHVPLHEICRACRYHTRNQPGEWL